MRCVSHPTHDSIFGDTYHGVANPLVPHQHPYPTRYHGPVFREPQAVQSFMPRPYDRPPFTAYQGLGEEAPPLFRTVTGSSWLDAAVGGVFGYLIAPKDQRAMWGAIGAAATGLGGTVGMVGTAAGRFVTQRK